MTQMIEKCYIIDAKTGLPIIQRQFRSSSKHNVLFFNTIARIIDEIHKQTLDLSQDPKNVKYLTPKKSLGNFTRIEVLNEMNIIFHLDFNTNILIAIIADLEDNQTKLIHILETLSRRFCTRYNHLLPKFRHTGKNQPFQSFNIEIDMFTLSGKIAETFPKLLIKPASLERLVKMETITRTEQKIAQLCLGKQSSVQISKELNLDYSFVNQSIEHLSRIDILKGDD